MSLYPSLEDMKVDQMAQVQQSISQQYQQQYPQQGPQHPPQQQLQYPQPGQQYPQPGAPVQSVATVGASSLYPTLDDYMGLQLSQAVIQHHMPETGMDVVRHNPAQGGAMTPYVAPITGTSNMGVMRAEVKQGIRQVICCKDQDGKVGIRVQCINKGVFVSLVQSGSPAALSGLRFGDQLLQIDGTTLAGFDKDKVFKILKKANAQRIELAVRDRPFERTITMQKDSQGHVGFIFKDGKIKSIVKDSSAARNGLLIEHAILEVNGQNVVGLKDNATSEILTAAGRSLTLTIMPEFIFDHMMKNMSSSLVKKSMDHSVPDL